MLHLPEGSFVKVAIVCTMCPVSFKPTFAGWAILGLRAWTVSACPARLRHADIKNGLSVPASLKIKNLINMARSHAGVFGMLASKRWTFGNLDGHVKGGAGVWALAERIGRQFDETLNWKDVEWIRSIWPRQADHQGHSRRGGRRARCQDRRGCDCCLKSRRPAGRWSSVDDLRCCQN